MIRTTSLLGALTTMLPLLVAFRMILLATLRMRHTCTTLLLRLDHPLFHSNINHPVRTLILHLTTNSWTRGSFHHHQVGTMRCLWGHRRRRTYRQQQSL